MAMFHVTWECAVPRTFRAFQVAGMFDLPPDRPVRRELCIEVPGLNEDWTIGAIVGPSGSGKTTLARAAFGSTARPWQPAAPDRALIDVVDDAAAVNCGYARWSIKELARVLIGVGLGSVPTWLTPYSALSTGQQFRTGLACGLLARADVLVCDEFTSALDRTLAKTTSAAVARLVRTQRTMLPRLVAVTCHDDVLAWLAPDWVVDLRGADGPALRRPNWREPNLELLVRRVPQAMWRQFAEHHYLSGGLARSATCYGAYVGLEGGPRAASAELMHEANSTRGCGLEMVGFCAAVATLGWKRTKHITRLVIRPEFQGLGLGGRLLAAVAQVEADRGNRVTITATHPAIVSHCSGSSHWRLTDVKKAGSTRQRFGGREIRSSIGRAVASFEFLGERPGG